MQARISYSLPCVLRMLHIPLSYCFLGIIQTLCLNLLIILPGEPWTPFPDKCVFIFKTQMKSHQNADVFPHALLIFSPGRVKFTTFFPQPLPSWLPSTYGSVLQLVDFLDCLPLRLSSLRTGTPIVFIIVFLNGSAKQSLKKCFIVYWINAKWSMNPSWFIVPLQLGKWWNKLICPSIQKD